MYLSYIFSVFSAFVLALGVSQEALELTRVSELSNDRIIRVTDGKLDLFTGVRDYHTIVILTSSAPEHHCGTCVNLMEAVKPVSMAWSHDYSSTNGLFFVEVDLKYAENQRLAAAIKLDTIPHIWLVPPNPNEGYDEFALIQEPHFIFRMPKGKISSQALEFADFLSKNLKKSIYLRDEDPITTFALYFLVTFLAIILFKRRGPKMVTNLGKKAVYMVLAIVSILTSTTGLNFVRMKKIAFLATNDTGGLIYITGGSHYQLGIEIIVMSVMYTVLAATLIGLIYIGKYKSSSTSVLSDTSKSVLIMVGTAVLYFLYSCLTSIVKRKDESYPYEFSHIF